jgi:hypothetical protein
VEDLGVLEIEGEPGLFGKLQYTARKLRSRQDHPSKRRGANSKAEVANVHELLCEPAQFVFKTAASLQDVAYWIR